MVPPKLDTAARTQEPLFRYSVKGLIAMLLLIFTVLFVAAASGFLFGGPAFPGVEGIGFLVVFGILIFTPLFHLSVKSAMFYDDRITIASFTSHEEIGYADITRISWRREFWSGIRLRIFMRDQSRPLEFATYPKGKEEFNFYLWITKKTNPETSTPTRATTP